MVALDMETGSHLVQLLEMTDRRQLPGQPFIGRMIMQILDLYLEGIVPIPSPDFMLE